jgi:hypothetical protein
MGVEPELYRARMGSFPARKPKVRASQEEEEGGEGACWFPGLILMVILVIGGVELNSDPPSEQDKLDQILAHMRNQECERKAIQKCLETHSQEMTNVIKETKEVKEKLEEISETIRGVIKGFRQMEQTREKWESWQQETGNRVDWLEDGTRKNNILICGIADGDNESYTDLLDKVVNLLSNRMALEVTAGSGVSIDEDFTPETRKIRKGLILYLKEARKRKHSLPEKRQATGLWMPIQLSLCLEQCTAGQQQQRSRHPWDGTKKTSGGYIAAHIGTCKRTCSQRDGPRDREAG